MTEFKPLEYAAAVAVFLVVVGFAAAYSWSAPVRHNSRLIYAGPWHAVLYLTGKILGVSALIGYYPVLLAYALVELWAADTRPAKSLDQYKERLLNYSVKGPLYHAQHAA